MSSFAVWSYSVLVRYVWLDKEYRARVITFGLESTSQEMFSTCLMAALITVDSAMHVGGSAEIKGIYDNKPRKEYITN